MVGPHGAASCPLGIRLEQFHDRPRTVAPTERSASYGNDHHRLAEPYLHCVTVRSFAHRGGDTDRELGPPSGSYVPPCAAPDWRHLRFSRPTEHDKAHHLIRLARLSREHFDAALDAGTI